MKARLRKCYQKSTEYDGDFEGRLEVVLTIECDGFVSSITAEVTGNLPSQTVGCVFDTLQAGQFDAVKNDLKPRTVTLPIGFVKVR